MICCVIRDGHLAMIDGDDRCVAISLFLYCFYVHSTDKSVYEEDGIALGLQHHTLASALSAHVNPGRQRYTMSGKGLSCSPGGL